MKRQIKGSIYLLITTIIWGTAFVAQSVGMDHIGPFTFQAVRSFIAVIALIPMIYLLELGKKDGKTYAQRWKNPRLWKTGLLCGLALFAACSLQQVGLVYTDAGKAGFITAMYIVLVPVFGLFLGQKPGKTVWVSVALAVVGLYLLSCMNASGINIGDLFLMGCAVAFAVQIILVDRLGQDLDGLRLNFVQFLVNALLSTVMMFLLEQPDWQSISQCAFPLIYTGVFSSGIAYSLQILGQQNLDPTPASLIMSLESVVAAIAGWLLLDQGLSPTERMGCALVFAGVILSQLPSKKAK